MIRPPWILALAAIAAAGPAQACDGRLWEVFFSGDANALSDEANLVLNDYAMHVLETPAITVVEIQGHTDSLGDAEANQRLSLSRAELVRDALYARGVPAALIKLVAYGETRPSVATGDNTREPLNSRVQLRDDSPSPGCILTLPPLAPKAP